MRTVARYLLREFALATTATLLGLLVTWTAADVMINLGELTESGGSGLAEVAQRLLDALPLTVPISALVGVVWSITHAVRHREITAIRSGGISLRSALLPILAAALT